MIDKIMFGNSTVNAVANSLSLTLANSTVTWTLVKPTLAQVTDTNYFPASDGTWKQAPGGATSLDGLSDVVSSGAANNDFLIYDGTAGSWENHAAGNGFSVDGNAPSVKKHATGGVGVDENGVYVIAAATSGLTTNSTGLWVTGGEGLVVNNTGVHVGTGNGIAVDADAVRVVAGTDGGLVSNSTGVWVDPGTGVTVNSLGVSIGQAVGTTDNVTFANVVTTDMTISGNLNVTGTLTTVDATNLVVNDSIIALARNNGADTLDIGLYGQYNDGTERFTGLIWDTTADTWELFANTTAEPTTTLDTGGTGFVRSTLSSYLKTGWGTGVFTASPTGVTITANSTWAVALTANSLSLSTPLPGTSGGTGLGTIAEDAILVANATNGFTALALGSVGLVLQSNGTALVYDTLDGGTF